MKTALLLERSKMMNRIKSYSMLLAVYFTVVLFSMSGCSSSESPLVREDRLIFSGMGKINKGQTDKAEKDFKGGTGEI